MKTKNYENVCYIGKYTEPCMCYPSAIKFDTLTEARKYAKRYTNVYVYRVYFDRSDKPLYAKKF